MRQIAFLFSLLTFVFALGLAAESRAQDDVDEAAKELEEIIEEKLDTREVPDDDDPALWYDLSFRRMSETASITFALRYIFVPPNAPEHIKISWDFGSAYLPLVAGENGSLSVGLIQLRPATEDARAGSTDTSQPDRTTLYLPPSTSTVDIELMDRKWGFGFDLGQFVVTKLVPVISDIIVVGNQTTLAYPFDSKGSDAGSGSVKTRRLIVTGENLRDFEKDSESVGPPSTTIVYAVDPSGVSDIDPGLILARAATDSLLFHAKAAKEPNQALIAKLETRREGLASAEDLIAIGATLKPGVTPGFKPLLIGEAQGSWPLLFGNQEAALQFVRHDDFVRTDSVSIFYPGDIGAVDLIFKTDIPFDSIGVRILHRPAAAKEGEEAKEVGVVLARRMDESSVGELPIFRTDPIHFVSKDNPLRRPPKNEDALYVNVLKGDKIGARLLDPARAKTQPPAVIAEIYDDPSELGELWKSALKRVAKCDGDKFDGDPKYALKKSTRVSRIVIGEMVKYVSPLAFVVAEMSGVDEPINFNPSVTLYKGDHAAALLIRDELVKMMAPLGQTFVPLANNYNGEATALRKWAVASRQADSLPILSRFKVSKNLVPREFIVRLTTPSVVMKRPLSWFLNHRKLVLRNWLITPDEFDAWLDGRIHAAAVAQSDNLQRAIGRAQDASDCKLLEMIVIAGQEAGPVAARIVPRLLKKIMGPGTPPTEYWAPDKLARGYVERMHIAAEAVAALDQYSKIDDAYKAMALAVATAGAAAGLSAIGTTAGLSAAGFDAAAAGLLIVGDVADAAYFGAKGLKSALESEAFYEFAAGASLILGEELLLEAEAQREGVGMALAGLIAPGIGAGFGLKDIRYFKNINKGKALLKAKGAGVLDDLDDLRPLQRRQLRAYLEDTLSEFTLSGLKNLDDDDLAALNALSKFEGRSQTLPPSTPTPRPNLPPEADPKGPFIGFDERMGDDFKKALDTDWKPDPFFDPYKKLRKITKAEDGRITIRPTENSRIPDAEAISFDEEALGQGSFNTAFKIDEDLIARVPGGDGGRPSWKELKADKGGREVFENASIDKNEVRLVTLEKRVKVDHASEIQATGKMHKSIQLNPGDEIEIVENFKAGTLKDNMKGRTVKRMTAEEAIAYDKGVRELNSKGLVALDLKYDNFGFEPVSQGAKELRLVILDPGGIVPIKDLDATIARNMQSQIDTIGQSGPFGRLLKKARLDESFGNFVDARALGLTEMLDIPFNPLGVSGFERGRHLASLSRADAEAYYLTLRAAAQ